jgi:phytanoyl-CoA dioxygenase PhyH
MIFRRRKSEAEDVQREPEVATGRSTEELLAEIDELTRQNRESPDPQREIRLVELRHAVGIRRHDDPKAGAGYPEPAFDRLPDRNGDLADVRPDQLSPELIRAGILRDGCLLVRGLVDPRVAEGIARDIDSAFEARDAIAGSGNGDPAYYNEFVPAPAFRESLGRDWIAGGGGLWAADSPHLLFEMLDTFDRAGLTDAIRGYLGEPPVISVQKCTLRRVDPDAGRGWHQDGAFLGEVRALNVWLSLSRCGDEAPGMDVIPRRLEEIVPTGTEGALFDWSVSEQVAEEAAGEIGVLRPTFEPGDVLLFDEMFLHTTAAEPEMRKSRWAIESWFFGASASPAEYSPLAA